MRVAILGYGLGGRAFHAPLVAATPGLQLRAVVTRDAARRAQLAHDHPGVEAIDTPAALWARADEFDLAVVTTPNGTHAPVAIDALRAGLHVVVDKPFATSVHDARCVVEEAERAGRTVTPFHNRRWDGDFLTVRRLLADGALGTVHRFESRFDRWRPVPKPRWCTADAAARGEGMLLDLAPHLVDQALVLFGPVASVYAELARVHPDVRTEDEAFVSLAHASGARSHLHMSVLTAQAGARFSIWGSHAAYVKHGLDVQEDVMRATARYGGAMPDGRAWGEEPETRWGTLGVGDDAARVRTAPGAYGAFYAGVAAMLRDGAPPPVAAEDAIAGLAVIDAALRSAREGRVVSMDGV